MQEEQNFINYIRKLTVIYICQHKENTFLNLVDFKINQIFN